MTGVNAKFLESIPLRASVTDGKASKGHLRPKVGTAQCLCMGCGEAFNSVGAFEMHQRMASDGSTICLDPAAITDRHGNPKPMVKNARGLWVTALDPRSYDRKAPEDEP